MLEWSEKFETGEPVIDAQHRMLVAYVNRLDVLAQAVNPTREEIELFFRFIEFLETYVLTHFQREEDCMFRVRCPAHYENKKAHTEFLDFLWQFKRQAALEGWRPELVKELDDSCNAWIQRHILRTDMRLKFSRDQAKDAEPR
ncbi:MAG TPA: hemerythrin domain-containing protein [Candidatus Acidoferrales bacterium]|nr:hemerythrin domain-containing protein [Candidatus Acidoferrales bacterium]